MKLRTDNRGVQAVSHWSVDDNVLAQNDQTERDDTSRIR